MRLPIEWILCAAALAQILPQTAPTILSIETAPQALIYLDDKAAGRTGYDGRFSLPNAKEGAHVLRIEAPRHQPYSAKIRIPSGRTTRIRADLTEFSADLQVFTTPGAEILVDGKSAGRADGAGKLLIPNMGALNYRHLRAALSGYHPEEREFRIEPGTTNSLTIELKPIAALTGNTSDPVLGYAPLRRLVGHTFKPGEGAGVHGIFFIAGTAQLVSWGEDLRILVWDANTGRQDKAFELLEGPGIYAVSPDLHWVAGATIGYQETRLIELQSGRMRKFLKGHTQAFSPDSKTLAMVGEPHDTGLFLTIKGGEPVKLWSAEEIRNLTYSPDGRWVATSETKVAVREAGTGKIVREFDSKGYNRRLVFSPDGRWLAVVHNAAADLWEVATGRQGPTLGEQEQGPHDRDIDDIAFTPDGRHVITADYGSLRLWDLASGTSLRSWTCQDCRRVAISPDGQWLAVIGKDLMLWRRE